MGNWTITGIGLTKFRGANKRPLKTKSIQSTSSRSSSNLFC